MRTRSAAASWSRTLSLGGISARADQDFLQGDVLLTAGTRLGARALLLAAADTPNCRCAVSRGRDPIDSGRRSRTAGKRPRARSNRSFRGLWHCSAGRGSWRRSDRSRDRTGRFRCHHPTAIEGAQAPTSSSAIGGASVGERDLVTDALARAGLQLDFGKGSPFAPVNRSSRPARIWKWLGDKDTGRSWASPATPFRRSSVRSLSFADAALLGQVGEDTARDAVLEAPLAKNGPRQSYLRATSTFSADGKRHVQALPLEFVLMAALAKADCLIVQAPDAPALPLQARA